MREISFALGNKTVKIGPIFLLHDLEVRKRIKFALYQQKEIQKFSDDYRHEWKRLSDSESIFYQNAFNLNFILAYEIVESSKEYPNNRAFEGINGLVDVLSLPTWLRYYGKTKEGHRVIGQIQLLEMIDRPGKYLSADIYLMYNDDYTVRAIANGTYAYVFSILKDRVAIDDDNYKEVVQQLAGEVDRKINLKKYLPDLKMKAEKHMKLYENRR